MATGSAPENLLSSECLSRLMLASLPAVASPQIARPLDAIALAANASMLATKFRLIGVGISDSDDDTTPPPLATPSSAESPQPLPARWNAQRGSYAFHYRHGPSSQDCLLWVSGQGGTAVVRGQALKSGNEPSIDVKVAEFVSAEKLPFDAKAAGKQTEDTEAQRQQLESIFLSAGRLSDFGSLMKVKLVQRLVGSMVNSADSAKAAGDDATTSATAADNTTWNSVPAERERFREQDIPPPDPLRLAHETLARPRPFAHPSHPDQTPDGPMPRETDEYQALRSYHPAGAGIPVPGSGAGYGENDRNPPGFGGAPNPFAGLSMPGHGGDFTGGGGGMAMSFQDRVFAPRQPPGWGQEGPQNPWGIRDDGGPYGPGPGAHPRGAGMSGRPPGGGFGGPGGFGGFGSGDFI